MHNEPKNNQKATWWDSLKGCYEESVFYDLWARHGKTRLNLLKKWIFDAKKEDEALLIVPRLDEKAIKSSELDLFLKVRRASLLKKEVQEEGLYTKDGGKPVFKAFSDTFTIHFFCLNNTVL